MISILLNASITGGIVILLWYLSYPLSKKYFKASWHYIILKITMLFLVFPVSVFAPLFANIYTGLFSKPELPYISAISEQIQIVNINAETINSVNMALADMVFSDAQYSPPFNQTDNISDEIKNTSLNLPYLQILWLTVAVIMLSGGIRKMHRFKKQILNSSNSDVDRETLELFLQYRNRLKVRGRINLRTSEYIKTPLAFGLINPLVILPETDMSADEKRLAFIHELTHIKNGDLWLKCFASVISAVHWFNPFAYLLRRKLSVISEEYCDECVIKKMEKEERFLYGNLILKVVSDISMPQFCSTLSAPTKNIKRRLTNMLNLKKSRKSMVALSVIAAFILCSLATIYAFAANTNAKITITIDNIESEEMLKEIYDEIAVLEKNLQDKFKDTNITVNTHELTDIERFEEFRKSIEILEPFDLEKFWENNEELREKFKQRQEKLDNTWKIIWDIFGEKFDEEKLKIYNEYSIESFEVFNEKWREIVKQRQEGYWVINEEKLKEMLELYQSMIDGGKYYYKSNEGDATSESGAIFYYGRTGKMYPVYVGNK